MKPSLNKHSSLRLAAFGALAALGFVTPALRAADHGDSPVASNNQNGDIADVYAFMDPNPGKTDNVILIATIRGFIAAGENSNFGIFDPNIRYHFDIETTGDTKADKFIDVAFTPRVANPGPTGKEILQVPAAQTATVTFTGFKDGQGKKLKSFSDLATTGSSTTQSADQTQGAQDTAAPAQVIDDVGTTGIKFFAGMVDDPFFFDIPGFSAFVKSVREGSPDPTKLSRGRDSFAGYNIMAIAFSIPKSLILGDGNTIGVAFESQRKIVQNPSKKTGDIKGTGVYHTIDRMGNPAVNVVLIPFNRKNEYNQGTPKDDANLRFAVDILRTLKALGTNGTGIDSDGNLTSLSDVSGNALVLANVAVLHGDYLRLDTTKANVGTGGGGPVLVTDNYGNGFPNGRRLRDDVVDILLSLVTNNDPAFLSGPLPFPVGDGTSASDPLPQDNFPFVHKPNQPWPTGTLDDKTRN